VISSIWENTRNFVILAFFIFYFFTIDGPYTLSSSFNVTQQLMTSQFWHKAMKYICDKFEKDDEKERERLYDGNF
jgi:ABC-type transport system involved in multi-copper enzyme maturation permease subunit